MSINDHFIKYVGVIRIPVIVVYYETAVERLMGH